MKLLIMICIALVQLFLGGCSVEEEYPKLRDLEFTVVEPGNEPETLISIIDEKKEEPFQLSYTIGDDMYLVIGYGKQEKGGYSIQVNDCYETEATIYIDTSLVGPESGEGIIDRESYPYIVIKMETIQDKLIEFH